ncbi:cytochrome P450 [Lasiosphaeria miniovina]|uniref:Cytochrome P450 n=1 Tax=Lasiosphaeria miniovina TaxID=1954250 RepID=A0AA40B342_9PEZI|nr:cytochrome P450 [Lasiosphaeria miniovina]KAK0726781.1 cytochrome P450 [Lasiosphaeria miniovina]
MDEQHGEKAINTAARTSKRNLPWLAVAVAALAASWLLVSMVRSYWRLAHIPGPFLARLTNAPRFGWVLSNKAHEAHVTLHRRYGPVVRFGPNMVSVGAPAEVGTVYRFAKPWLKSDFYTALMMKPNGKPIPGIFAAQDEDIHRRLKKPVSGAYAMTTLVSFEPYVDTTMRVLCDELRARFVTEENDPDNKPECDLGQWLQMFAFDVIGELTFSKRLGFLETGTDVNGVMASIWHMFQETALVTQMPWLDAVWTNNPVRRHLRGKGISPGAAFAMARVQERRALMQTTDKNDWDRDTRDFLSRFLEIEAKDPSLPPYALAAWASSNITAGSDTTGIYLRAMFHYLLTHPATLARLRAEVDAAAAAGDMPESLAPWRRARELPYLDACIKEAGRLHPPFGLPYERVVPPEGATVCGKFLPGGTVVGMSAFVVGRDRELFGDDADSWRPERWLEVGEEKRRRMEGGLIAFGAGHRSCMGKHIAYLEMYKVVPTLLLHFDYELVEPQNYRIENRWFVMQHGLIVRLKNRKPVTGQ